MQKWFRLLLVNFELFWAESGCDRCQESVAGFKLRKGVPIGCMLTIRGKRMYAFMNKLFNLACQKYVIFGVSQIRLLMVNELYVRN